MANSSLVSYTKISPNSTNPRNNSIKKITIHHMACNGTLEAIGEGFAKPSRKCSTNYDFASNGRVAMYCEEKNRAWCSGNADNDNQAITIEVANDGGAPNWHVSDKALAKLIDLCADICKRNNIAKLNFTGNKNGNLTMHRYFQSTECPGEYLGSKFPYIAEEVNKRIMTSYLSKGDKGETVKQLQELLNKFGYKLVVDGDFGNLTENAVKDFQSKNGLTVDGLAGQQTLSELKEYQPTVDYQTIIASKDKEIASLRAKINASDLIIAGIKKILK